MKIFARIAVLLLLCSPFYSCGPSQREKAVGKINEAKAQIISGDTLKAIETLGTVHTMFPKAKVQIEVSANMVDDLYRQMIDNRKEKLKTVDTQIDSLSAFFTKEKTEFDRYVQYIPKRLSFNHSWNKSFLQVNLDERGEIYLTSHYMGKDWLRHTAIRIYDGDLQVKTPTVPLDDPNNRESDFLDYKWEKVSYTDGKSDSTIRFIAENSDRKLKCVFLGKRYYYILLEYYNSKAIKDAYYLSRAIKSKSKLETEIKEFEARRK